MIPLRDALPARRRAVVTTALVGACVAMFLAETWISATGGDAALASFFDRFGLVPADLAAGVRARDLAALVPLVTYVFLHAGWLHVAGNMLYLWIFGNNVEDTLGRWWFVVAFFAFGIASALVQVAVDPSSDAPLIGASGAISGVLGVYLVLFPRARVMSLVFLVFFYQLMEVPAVLLLGLWFVLQLLSVLLSLGAPTETVGGVAFFAHIGGFLAGVAIGLVIRLLGRARRPPVRLAVG